MIYEFDSNEDGREFLERLGFMFGKPNGATEFFPNLKHLEGYPKKLIFGNLYYGRMGIFQGPLNIGEIPLPLGYLNSNGGLWFDHAENKKVGDYHVTIRRELFDGRSFNNKGLDRILKVVIRA